MSVLFRAVLFIVICAPSLGLAGAWQRAPGTGFAATSVRLTWPQNVAVWTGLAPTGRYNTLYIEYGLTPRLTLGLDVGRSVSGQSKTVAFLQMPIRNRDKGPKIAAQLGVGKVADQTVIRPGLSLGWGLDHGWLAIDSVTEFGLEQGNIDWKADVTWGRNLNKGRKLMVQIQTGETTIDPLFARIAPSLVTPLNDRLMLETGVSMGLVGDSSMGVTVGMWMEF